MGESCAAEVLKTLDHKEVETIIESMNSIGEVSENEVIRALNDFFKDTKSVSSLNVTTNDYIHNTLVSAVGSHKADSMIHTEEAGRTARYTGLELMKWQTSHQIVEALREEHPQIITICIMCLDSDKAAAILKILPTDLRKDIIKRITNCSTVSQFAMQTISNFLENQFAKTEKYKNITSDGVNLAASIIAKLDLDTETELLNHLSQEDETITSKIEGRLFPFEKLAELEPKSLQTLLTEASQDDVVLALKGADDNIKATFFKNMSAKTAELLKDDMDSTGPVKLSDVFEAQKRIVTFAKKLNKEEKIFIPSNKNNNEMVG